VKKNMLKQPQLFPNGFSVQQYPLLPTAFHTLVDDANWLAIDQAFQEQTAPSGKLFQWLLQFHEFDSIEFIISVRDSADPDQEDGIWHDDGSRQFSFSLSLTENPQELRGGDLGLRKIGEENFERVPTPPFGNVILFLTGTYGFEHKIHQVTRGKRIMLVGWCSQR
jgi:hypothetical protein